MSPTKSLFWIPPSAAPPNINPIHMYDSRTVRHGAGPGGGAYCKKQNWRNFARIVVCCFATKVVVATVVIVGGMELTTKKKVISAALCTYTCL
jgi:hypothetical protein